MIEFALLIPLLVLIVFGAIDLARAYHAQVTLTNASREAVRYASAVGLDDSGSYNKYNYCSGIKDMARRSAYFTPLTINISYDKGPGTASYNTCDGTVDSGVVVSSGDRVLVTVSAQYKPMLKLIPLSSRTFTSSSSRTILGLLKLEPCTGC